ncbi:MAG: hypothetical protein WAX44_01910 [Minisyncoccia bacterium]
MKKYFFLLALILSLLPFYKAHSQGLEQINNSVNMEVIPLSPRAYQTVRVTLTNYIKDLDSSTITWQVNGRTEASGKGIKNFSFTVGGISQTTTLEIIVVFNNGSVERKKINIKPSDVDLIWQSESFVPPFYKGKRMFSHENRLSIIAFPHMTNENGVEINPKSLVYKWSKSENVVSEASGYGKNIYTFNGPLISRSQNITVEVTSPDNPGLRAFARFDLPPVEPELIFYRKNPLYGIELQRALAGEVELKDSKEIVVIGMPYYFGVLNSFSSDLLYKWAINGVQVAESSGNIQTFRQKEGVSGTANISLSIENTEKILQYASTKFNLKFGEISLSNPIF